MRRLAAADPVLIHSSFPVLVRGFRMPALPLAIVWESYEHSKGVFINKRLVMLLNN